MPVQVATERRAEDDVRSFRGPLPSVHPWLATALVSAFAGLILWLVVAPLAGAVRDTDATSTVLYFDRLVHGQRLEAFVPTTPKPLLTVVYGVIWTLTDDWRALTIATLIVAASSVGMASRLAWRLAGPAAGAVVMIGMLAWPDFQLEVAHANSFVWGLALWLVAALAITAERPRPWLAGVALLLAGLARTETVWLLGAAGLVAAWSIWLVFRGSERSILRLTLPPLIGLLFLPLACLHDLLLTGQPLYWLGVPAGYTALAYPGLAATSPLRMAARELVYYRPALPLLPLAALGWLVLVRARRLAVSLGLACLAAGVSLTLIVLAWRATYISVRYYEEANAVVLLTAAVAIGWGLSWGFDRLGSKIGSVGANRADVVGWIRPVGPVLLSTLLALGIVLVDVPQHTLDASSRESVQATAALESHLASIEPILATAGGSTLRVAGVGYPVTDASGCRMLVPRPLLNTIAIETGARITSLCDSTLTLRMGREELHAGEWVLHIVAADGKGGAFSPFEIASTTSLSLPDRTVALVPVIVDPANGCWLIRIDPAS